jgi:hypothetical protein
MLVLHHIRIITALIFLITAGPAFFFYPYYPLVMKHLSISFIKTDILRSRLFKLMGLEQSFRFVAYCSRYSKMYFF